MHTYNIVVLGASGSGKTVFLASMYNKLRVQRDDTSFFLHVGEVGQRELIKKYKEVARSGEWPPPTKRSEMPEWTFTCRVQNGGGMIYDACQFTYIDYAGEKITEAPEDSSDYSMFYAKLKEADAFLAILDGHKVRSLMEDGDMGTELAFEDLPNITAIIQNTNIPVHFVITKWDLLDTRYTLKQIRDKLFALDDFKEFVRGRAQRHIPIRLIPVSSVGMEFACLQPDGLMHKVVGTTPAPFQVEVPLACILPDNLKAKVTELINRERELQSREVVTVQPTYSFWQRVKGVVADIGRAVKRSLPSRYHFGEAILQKLIEATETDLREKQEDAVRRMERLRRERDASLQQVRDDRSAIEHAINSFAVIASTLRSRFPESDLTLPM